MKALCWHGKHNVRIETVSDPRIESPDDAIIKTTSTAICGTDLHIFNGIVTDMKKGDILGHEFMGQVIEVGPQVKQLKIGDRVVIPAVIACGRCDYCQKKLFSLCQNANPNSEKAKKKMSQAPCGVFGYSHLTGGYPGGQAEFVRVPFADVNAFKVESSLSDEQVLFLTDIFPTGFMAAENADISSGKTVAIWGCGPVGQLAIQSAWLLGAERIIAIDLIPERLQLAKDKGKAETIDFSKEDVFEKIMSLTNGEGVDCCIDAVGTEASSCHRFEAIIDRLKQSLFLASDRPYVLREAIRCCKKGGTVSVPGVYLGNIDKIPFGEVMNKNLTLRSGNTHMHKYINFLLKTIQSGKVDPSFIITHRMKLAEAEKAYELFNNKKDKCIKVVMTP